MLLKTGGVARPLGLALLVIFQSRHRVNWLFVAFMLVLAWWNGATLMAYLTLAPALSGLIAWEGSAFLAVVAIPLTLCGLAMELAAIEGRGLRRAVWGAGALGFLFVVPNVWFNTYGIQASVRMNGSIAYSFEPFSLPFVLTLAFVLCFFFLAEAMLFWPIFRSRPTSAVWQESKAMLGWGGVLTGLGGLSEVFPAVGGYPVDSAFMIGASLIFAYVILDQQLFDPLRQLNEDLALVNQQLRESNKRIRQADRLKGEFLANMSHELRTPLNSIIGFSKVMLNEIDGPLTEAQQIDLTAIYTSGQYLLSLVNDVLDLSKIQAGKMELHKEWLDFREIVAGVMATAIALVDQKPIELIEEVQEGLPRVYADRTRMRQVVLNLVSNAAKFTDEGAITLRVEQAGENMLTCSVTDTGIGIVEKDIPLVFEEFRQLDNSVARRAEGSGLGLAISKQLVEVHGGRLWAESEPGKGSTFFFTLPVDGGHEAQRSEGEPVGLEQRAGEREAR